MLLSFINCLIYFLKFITHELKIITIYTHVKFIVKYIKNTKNSI